MRSRNILHSAFNYVYSGTCHLPEHMLGHLPGHMPGQDTGADAAVIAGLWRPHPKFGRLVDLAHRKKALPGHLLGQKLGILTLIPFHTRPACTLYFVLPRACLANLLVSHPYAHLDMETVRTAGLYKLLLCMYLSYEIHWPHFTAFWD